MQERFGAEGAVQREDLVWASTLGVGLPFDERLELSPGLTLHHVGGHFDGQGAGKPIWLGLPEAPHRGCRRTCTRVS